MSAIAVEQEQNKPRYRRSTYAVWEITLKCNLACSHCGSRAGDSRVDELSTEEALDLVQQMADLGINEITLIGGEAYLRKDWLIIAKEITRLGMKATMTTGGYGISLTTAQRMKEAGIATVSVSIDGLEDNHDQLRGKKGSWQQCFNTLEHLKTVGIPFGINTQINRMSAIELPLLYEKLVDAGAVAWQIQLTVPMGNAVEHNAMLLQPVELLDLYPVFAYLSKKGREDNFMVQAGNNVGYFGPYERLLRAPNSSHEEYAFYQGCNAGQNVIGIEADGSIKGCPSLPTSDYTGGNIRKRSLSDIYHNTQQLRFNDINSEEDKTAHLWGECAKCEFAKVCRGGCNWTSHVFFGKRGNNPYCHHRAIKKAALGKRETFSLQSAASGQPFDYGIFELKEEDFGTLDPLSTKTYSITRTQFPESWLEKEPDLKQKLLIERGLNIKQYVDSGIVAKEDSPWYDPAFIAQYQSKQKEQESSRIPFVEV